MLLGLVRSPPWPLLPPPPFSPPNSKSKSTPHQFLPLPNPNFPSLSTTNSLKNKRFRTYASDGQKNEGGPLPPAGSGDNGDEGKAEPGRLGFNFRWTDLVLDPDPDNIVAVGLTGLLTWASVQVLWQLVVISAAILVAALKYTIVAALLVFILITLL